MTTTVLVLNGSNLNLLGKREPHLYGTTTLAEIKESCCSLAKDLGLQCDFRQTNYEGEMVDWLQEAFEKEAAVIINPADFPSNPCRFSMR
jgi:3-dehydroquinate dehydratase-2